MPAKKQNLIVAGVDVGGRRKGFHAVALQDGAYLEQKASPRAKVIAEWCRKIGTRCVGVDAPCRWSADGHSRPAERRLMGEGIWCFSTPTREMAVNHRTNHYGWMLNGEALFRLLATTHPLPRRLLHPGRSLCFETFPHAIACCLHGSILQARNKRQDRSRLLGRAGIATDRWSIDTIDAGLCALTAHYLVQGNFRTYGEAATGFIVVPGNFE